MQRSFPSPARGTTAGAAFALLCGAGLGAALMFLLDPASGRRRRALLREKSAHYARRARERQAAMLRHASHRARGALATVRRRVHPEEIVEDAVLLERVRAALGHAAGDPHAIDIRVRCGTVVLKGPAREDQVAELVACARNVRGVLGVENHLSLNLDAASVDNDPDGIAR